MGKGLQHILRTPLGVLAVALVAIGLLLVNPVGYLGAGKDDFKYLSAARCWVEIGHMCQPTNHWEARWPVLATLTSSLALLGEGRSAVSLGSLPWWIAAIAATGWVGRLVFSRTAGLWSAVMLASVPVVTWFSLRPNPDLPELTFQLLAIGTAVCAVRERKLGWAIAAGVATGLAIASRQTSLLFALLSLPAWWLLAPRARQLLGWALVAGVATVGAEWLVYALTTGDPLARQALAVGHGGIPSAYLKDGVDLSQSPILNPDFIAGWVRPMGIEVWWPIDGLLNLLADPMIGLWLVAGVVAAWWRLRQGQPEERRALVFMLVFAAIFGGGLIYGLAVDPRPRMFMLPIAFSCLALGNAIAHLWRQDRQPLASVVPVAILFAGAVVSSQQVNSRPLEAAAARWIGDNPDGIETDAQTAEMLATVRAAQGLPLSPAGRDYRVTLRLDPCERALGREIAEGSVRLVDQETLASGASLCLLRYGTGRAEAP